MRRERRERVDWRVERRMAEVVVAVGSENPMAVGEGGEKEKKAGQV